MNYPFIRKDEHITSKDEPAVAKAIVLFKTFVEFDSWYRREADYLENLILLGMVMII